MAKANNSKKIQAKTPETKVDPIIKVKLNCNCPYGTNGDVVQMKKSVAVGYGKDYVEETDEEITDKSI